MRVAGGAASRKMIGMISERQREKGSDNAANSMLTWIGAWAPDGCGSCEAVALFGMYPLGHVLVANGYIRRARQAAY